MTKALTFWSVFLGFGMGIAYNIVEKVIDMGSEVPLIEVLKSFEYQALAVVVPFVILLSLILYQMERDQITKTEEFNNTLYNKLDGLTLAITNLGEEIRKDRRIRQKGD